MLHPIAVLPQRGVLRLFAPHAVVVIVPVAMLTQPPAGDSLLRLKVPPVVRTAVMRATVMDALTIADGLVVRTGVLLRPSHPQRL